MNLFLGVYGQRNGIQYKIRPTNNRLPVVIEVSMKLLIPYILISAVSTGKTANGNSSLLNNLDKSKHNNSQSLCKPDACYPCEWI